MYVRILILLTLILMGCPDNIPLPIDGIDVAVDVIEQKDSDLGIEDIVEDIDIDLGPQDSDGDGLLDGADNCPMVVNPNQLDRDRDGVGDLCDNYPFIWDTNNPVELDLLQEDESLKPNNNEDDAEAAYGRLALPMIVSSKVDATSDLDWFAFEVTEPTALLLHMKTNATTWPAAIIVGRDFRNANVYRVAISPAIGSDIDREMFIAMPGKYVIITSDLRNLITSAADVGGDGFEYSFSLSRIPLPTPEIATLDSGPIPKTYKKVLNVYEINTKDKTAVIASGVGATVEPNTFHNPAITVLDGNDPSHVIANTGTAEVDAGKVDTIFQVSTEKILLVEDFVDRFGSATSTVQFQSASLDREPETDISPADERADLVPWIEVNSQIEGALTPRNGVADEDYFLLSARRGEAVEIILTPVDPLASVRLDIGHWIPNQNDSFFISAHRSESEENATGPTSLRYFFDSGEDGELAIRILNKEITGVSVDYKLELKRWTVVPNKVSGLPQQLTVDLSNGDLGIVEIDLMANTIVSSFTEDVEIFSDTRWTDLGNWKKLSNDGRDISFRVPQDGSYRLDVRDLLGRAGSTKVSIISSVANPVGVLPASENRDLILSPKQFFSVQLNQGDLLDVRVNAQNFYPQIEILNKDFERQSFGYVSEIFEAPEMGEYLVVISASDGRRADDRSFVLGLQKPNPSELMLSSEKSGVVDSRARARWYKIDVAADQDYEVRLNPSNFSAIAEIIDPTNLKTIVRSSDGVLRWHADTATKLWVSVSEVSNDGNPAYDFTILFSELTSFPITDGDSVLGTISPDTFAYFDFQAPPGLVKVSLTQIGDWRPTILLLDGDTNQREFDAEQVGNRLVFGQSTTRNYRLAIGRKEHQTQSLLDFTLQFDLVKSSTNAGEVEPNNDRTQAQPLITGSGVSGTTAGMEQDWYTFALGAQQRFWVFVTDRNNGGLNRFDAELGIRDENGQLLESNRFSGEGYLPAVHGANLPFSGTYTATFGPRTGTTLDGGYALYYLAEDIVSVSESEPNGNLVDAQIVPSFYETIHIETTGGAGDLDLIAVRIPVSETDVLVSLEGAADGFELRLLDGSGTQLAASGPSYDGNVQPIIEYRIANPGLFYLELSAGVGVAKIVFSKMP